MRLTVQPRFEAELKRLPPHRQRAAIRALEKLQRVPPPRGLDFRSLSKAPGFFIIDPNAGDRIVLYKIDDDHFSIEDVGPHDNVYRRWNR